MHDHVIACNDEGCKKHIANCFPEIYDSCSSQKLISVHVVVYNRADTIINFWLSNILAKNDQPFKHSLVPNISYYNHYKSHIDSHWGEMNKTSQP